MAFVNEPFKTDIAWSDLPNSTVPQKIFDNFANGGITNFNDYKYFLYFINNNSGSMQLLLYNSYDDSKIDPPNTGFTVDNAAVWTCNGDNYPVYTGASHNTWGTSVFKNYMGVVNEIHGGVIPANYKIQEKVNVDGVACNAYPVTKAECVEGLSTAITEVVGDLHLWTGTQAEYDAITTKDSNTLYFIKAGD